MTTRLHAQREPAQRLSAARRHVAPESVHRVLRQPGTALPADVQADAQRRFGFDFSSVRIHADEAAGASARDLGFRAYALRPHVVFAPEMYRPETKFGKALLLHELGHIRQQQEVVPGKPIAVSHSAEHERNANQGGAHAPLTMPANVVAGASGSVPLDDAHDKGTEHPVVDIGAQVRPRRERWRALSAELPFGRFDLFCIWETKPEIGFGQQEASGAPRPDYKARVSVGGSGTGGHIRTFQKGEKGWDKTVAAQIFNAEFIKNVENVCYRASLDITDKWARIGIEGQLNIGTKWAIGFKMIVADFDRNPKTSNILVSLPGTREDENKKKAEYMRLLVPVFMFHYKSSFFETGHERVPFKAGAELEFTPNWAYLGPRLAQAARAGASLVGNAARGAARMSWQVARNAPSVALSSVGAMIIAGAAQIGALALLGKAAAANEETTRLTDAAVRDVSHYCQAFAAVLQGMAYEPTSEAAVAGAEVALMLLLQSPQGVAEMRKEARRHDVMGDIFNKAREVYYEKAMQAYEDAHTADRLYRRITGGMIGDERKFLRVLDAKLKAMDRPTYAGVFSGED